MIKPRSAMGLTLVEMMVTVAIAAILLAVAAPSFMNLIAQSRLTTQTNDLIAAMNLARSEAVRRNTSVRLCRATTATPSACATTTADWTTWLITTTGGAVIRTGVINTYGGTMRTWSNLTSDRLTFGPDGLSRTGGALSTNSTISLCTSRLSSDNTRTISIGAGSRVSTTVSSGGC